MGSLRYVGKLPSNSQDVITKLQTENLLNSEVTRTYVQSRVLTKATLKASKAYVDTQDSTFASSTYYGSQDSSLLVPLTSKGAPNGVATLDESGKIPLAQMPILGNGVLIGPFGMNSMSTGTLSTDSTPLKICSWNIGVQNYQFRPIIFFAGWVKASNLGRPVVELRMSNGASTTYASQTLIGRGFGRSYFNDYQAVNALPCPDVPGTQNSYPVNYNIQIYAWLYDANNQTVQLSTVANSCVYLLRTSA